MRIHYRSFVNAMNISFYPDARMHSSRNAELAYVTRSLTELIETKFDVTQSLDVFAERYFAILYTTTAMHYRHFYASGPNLEEAYWRFD